MNLKQMVATSQCFIKTNSPTILSALAVSGVAGTAYLAGKASWTSAEYILLREETESVRFSNRERVKMVWKNYIPAAITVVATTTCIVGAQRAGAKRTAAAQAAFALTERAFSEYRDKVVEEIGEGKERKIRDELRQDQVNRNPPVIIEGSGVMCMEAHTGRYFFSDMETLRKACNTINAKMFGGVYATLNDLYDILDLDYTPSSGDIGWEAGRPLEFEFSTALYKDKPVLVFSYNYIKAL